MSFRRTIATTLATAAVVAMTAACSPGGDFSESNAATGVVVQGPNRARSGELKIEQAATAPPMPAGFTHLGPITKITGKLTDHVTITIPLPADFDAQQLANLRIMRHDGKSWGAILPQHVDLQQRLVKTTTSEFSLWGLSTWDVEQAAADFLAAHATCSAAAAGGSSARWASSRSTRRSPNAAIPP
ncbi:hypothetical protein [Catellatospora sichuanensis]|uniref:hypothetical protein n=1 Tax=Catellatospora sichuanensis TaxID=1969805 RepID=UPI00118449AA|nr:hypothetical protein [Catellatospora sichuanensis]